MFFPRSRLFQINAQNTFFSSFHKHIRIPIAVKAFFDANVKGIHIVRQHHLVWVDRHVKFTGDAVFGGIHYADGAASEVGDIQFVIFRLYFTALAPAPVCT